MAEYKITNLSDKPASEWQGPGGTIYYKRVMLEGHSKPVEIGKKKPDALKVGDIVNGDIKPDAGVADKFKATPMQQGFGGGHTQQGSGQSYKKEYTPRDDDAIRAQWAIGQSVQIVAVGNGTKEYSNTRIEEVAKDLYQMVDRVKGSKLDTSSDPMDKVHAQNPMNANVTDEFGDGAEYVNNTELPPGF